MIGTAGGVVAHGLAWPGRLTLIAALALGVRGVLWLFARRLGESSTANLVNRAIGAFIGTAASTLIAWAIAWSVMGRDPGALIMIGIVIALFPIWWLLLRWWAATSPGATSL